MCENFADNSGISKPEHRKDIPFELEKKLQIQHESCGWTLYTERAHVENIFYSRFNYFMLFFTLFVSVIVAIYVSDDINYKGWIMFFLSLWGFIILLCLRRTLIKTYKFLECILKWLDSMSQNYVSPMIRMRFGPRKYEKMNYYYLHKRRTCVLGTHYRERQETVWQIIYGGSPNALLAAVIRKK